MHTNIFCGYGGINDDVVGKKNKKHGFSETALSNIYLFKVLHFCENGIHILYILKVSVQRSLCLNVCRETAGEHSSVIITWVIFFFSNCTVPRWELRAPTHKGVLECIDKLLLFKLKWNLMKGKTLVKEADLSSTSEIISVDSLSLFTQEKDFYCQSFLSFFWKPWINKL